MKALTLTQPYATLIAIGAKRIETRGWSTAYHGPLAIHAGAGLGPVGGRKGLRELVASESFFTTLVDTVAHAPDMSLVDRTVASLPLGAIVAVATLVSVFWKTHLFPGVLTLTWGGREATWQMTDQERAFGDYSPGRYAWLLADVRRLAEPVPCKGALSLWELPADVLAAVNAQL